MKKNKTPASYLWKPFISLSPSQTKDALFTILRDLRPGDHFNFVSFSNKIKVWQPNRLVPVTPLNVRDAKKFIFTLMPTGGETSWFFPFTNTIPSLP